MRVLLVEDEPNAAHVLAKGLREQSYAVDLAADGEAAVFQAATTDYDAVVLDVMLPKRDGFAVCRTIRESGCAVPILMVTARDAVEARIEGLDCGADDYLVKPFDFGELLARLRALIRRGGQPLLPEQLTVGRLVLDTRGRHVYVAGHQVRLTPKEYALLEYLAYNAGRVLTRDQILAHVWPSDYEGASNTVDVFIRYLRRKIDEGREPRLIETVIGLGYTLKAPE
jgi:DNA-binding response OmpR family regulator